MGRDDRINRPGKQPGSLQFTELEGQHLLGDVPQLALDSLNRLVPLSRCHRRTSFHLPPTSSIASSNEQLYCGLICFMPQAVPLVSF